MNYYSYIGKLLMSPQIYTVTKTGSSSIQDIAAKDKKYL